MPDVSSFRPVARPDARLLILGSMPGDVSLKENRYYAHPRNAFWPILAELCGFDVELDYADRLQQLQQNGIALWDVLQSCSREGSLDSDIDPRSIRTNDFDRFFRRHDQIAAVFCNGGTSHRLFLRHVDTDLPVVKLPSTSPAYAAMRFENKLAAWRDAIGPLLR